MLRKVTSYGRRRKTSMGTRGAFGFRLGGLDKITYNHYDSYPEHLGTLIVEWLKTAISKNAIKATIEAVENLRLVTEDSEPTSEDIQQLARFTDRTVNRGAIDDWYVLLRRAQPSEGIEKVLDAGIILDAKAFLANSLFCEYAYIVNFDDMTFEVYRGFQRTRHQSGRYASATQLRDYYPVALVKALPLDEINLWANTWVEDLFPSEE